jgi:hypothetical protein
MATRVAAIPARALYLDSGASNIMRSTIVVLMVAAAQSLPPAGTDALKVLQSRVPVEPVHPSARTDLAGHYTGESPELKGRVGPFLSGKDLYLFPDGSYLYSQWADVMPMTIFDKGHWSAASNVLELVSDKDIAWDPEIERRHVIVRRKTRPREAMLVGLSDGLDYFKEKAGDDPELMLLIVGMVRTDALDEKTAPAFKRKLIKDGWRPSFFRD